jgi:hypothetical protein
VAGDGCSTTCTIEPNYQCSGEPSVCELNCNVPEALWTESGCPDGQMCTVLQTGDIDCTNEAANIADYSPCTNWNDCQSGAMCIGDRHGSNSCLPFCDSNGWACASANEYCYWNLTTNQGEVGLCEQQDACDPTQSGVAAGCASGQGCYRFPAPTYFCQTAGSKTIGQGCTSYSDCVPGASCMNFGNTGDPACYEMCNPSGAWTCTLATYTCQGIVGDTWRACMPP